MFRQRPENVSRPASRQPAPAGHKSRRRGAIVVLAAVMLVVLFGFVAFGVDVGYMALVRTQLHNATDCAALAAVGVLRDTGSISEARDAAVQYASMNEAAGKPVSLDPVEDVQFGQRVYDEGSGSWTFVPNLQPYDSVRVTAQTTEGLFFGRVLGVNSFDSATSASATFLPRDIALVIDLSGSMLYDSSLKREGETEINIQDIWVALGSPTFGTMQSFDDIQYLSGSTSSILEQLELDDLPYPYPGGSWYEYVRYVKDPMRSHMNTKGYRHKYGLKTFVDYLLWIRSYKSSTPILSDTPEQPVTAVKEATAIMMDYLETLDTEEFVSLVTYDTSSRVELDLTTDLGSIANQMYYMQAGHYDRSTNIGAGIKNGRDALNGPNARPNARKMLVVLTDGLANVGGSGMSPSSYAIYQAQQAAAEGITIHTVTFTDHADQNLMAQVAEIGKGMHFHVPNYNVAQYTADLEEVFLTISSLRPLVLTE